ncbi:LexA family protein [Pseudohongiella sp. O18]|uniref:LexA family protein n=1 Tax=Pseudohongiella sp. O18 TaxID=2904248 RepID=UPI001F18F58C|nr:LexA family transcriptional regulator [Pseudohongiella sp. O18]
MKTWHDRLNIALENSGLTKADLAKRIGVSRPTVTDWTKGNIKTISGGNAEKLSRHLGVSVTWLLTGHGAMRPNSEIGEINAAYTFGKMNRIPLVSWADVGAWCESRYTFDPERAEDWLQPPEKVGDGTFAVVVVNDSMIAPYPGMRSYPQGTIIYVDPEKVVTNGCRVVAKAGGEYMFKQYIEDAGKRYLKPLNPTYEKIEFTEDVQVCGVVIGSYLPE